MSSRPRRHRPAPSHVYRITKYAPADNASRWHRLGDGSGGGEGG
ncbi:hypothetical protein AB0F71_13040 [Kitasatospora sp. NPDC028055]